MFLCLVARYKYPHFNPYSAVLGPFENTVQSAVTLSNATFQAERDRSHQAIPTPIVTKYFLPGQYDRQDQRHCQRQLLHCDLVVPSSSLSSSSYHHLIPNATLSIRHHNRVSSLAAPSQYQPWKRIKQTRNAPSIGKDIICIAKKREGDKKEDGRRGEGGIKHYRQREKEKEKEEGRL